MLSAMGIADLVGRPRHSPGDHWTFFYGTMGFLLLFPAMGEYYRTSRRSDRAAGPGFGADRRRDREKSDKIEALKFFLCTGLFLLCAVTSIMLKAQPGHWEAEIAEKTKAIAQSPDDASNYVDRGRSYLSDEDYDKAAADADRALALDPNRLSAYVLLATIRLRSGAGYEAALAEDGKAIALDPSYVEAYLNRAEIYLKMREFEQAIADTTTAIAVARHPCRAYVDRSKAYNRLGRYDEAIADTSLAISTCSFDLGDAYDSRGFAYEHQGRRDEAIADYRAGLALWAHDFAATAGLRRLGAAP